MPGYNEDQYSPAASVATVSVPALASGATVDEISMLLDSGADISALPKRIVDELQRFCLIVATLSGLVICDIIPSGGAECQYR